MSSKKFDLDSIVVGTRIFAKVRGYPHWPARVERIIDDKKSRFEVFFYGTYESAVVKKEDVFLYDEDNFKKFGNQKRKMFPEGMHEIEYNPTIKTREQIEKLIANTSAPTLDIPPSPTHTTNLNPTPISENKKGRKRKSVDSPSPQVFGPESIPSDSSKKVTGEERVSRSGRVIKAKKFDDGFLTSTTKGDDSDSLPSIEEERKMWVTVKGTDHVIQLNLDKNRPIHFDSKEEEQAWKESSAKNALMLSSKVENGDFVPQPVIEKIRAKTNPSEEEKRILEKHEDVVSRAQKVNMLKEESNVVTLDLNIKRALHITHPQMQKCVQHLTQIISKQIRLTPLIVKKQPQIVTTIRKLRKYVGPKHPTPTSPTASSKQQVEEEWRRDSAKIRAKADKVFAMISEVLGLKNDATFWNDFDVQLAAFKQATNHLDQVSFLALVEDPTSHLNM